MNNSQREDIISEKQSRAGEIGEKTDEIAKKIQEEKDRISEVGDFSTAYCSDYDIHESNTESPAEVRSVEFEFKTPDGSVTVSKQVGGEFERFLEEHNAQSLFEMIGKGHTCIKTYDGWELHDNTDASADDYEVVEVFGETHINPRIVSNISNWSYALAAIFTIASVLYHPYALAQGVFVIALVLIGNTTQRIKERRRIVITPSEGVTTSVLDQ